MARMQMLLLEYDAEAALDCGVVCSLAGPIPHYSKEPVGHVFHHQNAAPARRDRCDSTV